MNSYKFYAIKRSELEKIKEESNPIVKDYLSSIIKNGTEIWKRKDNKLGVHLGMNDYIIHCEGLVDIIDKVKVEEEFYDIIDINTITTFENQFNKKEYIHYLSD